MFDSILTILPFIIIFFIVGAAMIIYSVKLIIAAKNGREVTATVVDVIISHRRGKKGRMRTYYTPVYAYYDGGELKNYRSIVSSSVSKPIGSEETLYISEDERIIEKAACITYLITGILFAGFGIAFGIAAVCSMREQ